MIVKLSATKFINLDHVVKVTFSERAPNVCAVVMIAGPTCYLNTDEADAIRTALGAENRRTEMMHRIFPMPGQETPPVEFHISDEERKRLIHGDWHEPKD